MILCFDLETKNKLISNGHTFLREVDCENKKGFLFFDDGNIIEFDKNKIIYTEEAFF